MQDPEFAAFYKQNVENLKSSYSDALEKAKEDLAVLCGVAPEGND
jgi:ABC-type Zn uptake system ZnuABC Zn-binding protein ZnuA